MISHRLSPRITMNHLASRIGAPILALALLGSTASAQYDGVGQAFTNGGTPASCSSNSSGLAANLTPCSNTSAGYTIGYSGSANALDFSTTSFASGPAVHSSGFGQVNLSLTDRLLFAGTIPDRLFIYVLSAMTTTASSSNGYYAYADATGLVNYGSNSLTDGSHTINGVTSGGFSSTGTVVTMGGVRRVSFAFAGDQDFYVQSSTDASVFSGSAAFASGDAFAFADFRIVGIDAVDIDGNSLVGQTSCSFRDSGMSCNLGELDIESATPEPGSLILLVTGLLAIGGLARRRTA